MSEDLVTFNVRCGKSLYQLKITPPSDVYGLIEKLKIEFDLEDTDEIVILYASPDGKMLEINTDEDIEILKKTKLCYNAVSKEIYCSVELVVIVVHEPLKDDPKIQIMNLSKKFDQLSFQFDQLSGLVTEKLEENTSNILKNIRSILSEQSPTDSGNAPKKNSIGEQNKPNVTLLSNSPIKPQKKAVKKEKLPTTSFETLSLPNTTENLDQQSNTTKTPKDIDSLLDMLVKEGFNNTIQNIIVLKRFDNDYEKAVNYLKSSAA